jgi:uncharacterized heparinase superfamily protein
VAPTLNGILTRGLRWGHAIGAAAAHRVAGEWQGTPPHLFLVARPKTQGLAAYPHDGRPVDSAQGRAALMGVFEFFGDTLRVGPDGDPWDRPSPTRRFAAALHKMDWLGDLLSLGETGARHGLRLVLDWRRGFGRYNRFAWGAEVMERRVFNLACGARTLLGVASEAEALEVLDVLARQARFLLDLTEEPQRRLDRAVAAAVAGAALAGPAGDRLLDRALKRLETLIPEVVLPDGGHVSRSPEAGLELLFDLTALDQALAQRGRTAPQALQGAIDRLASGVRFFTLADGRLAAFQGGAEVSAARVACALAGDPGGPTPPDQAMHARYQKLTGQSVQVIADVGAAAPGPYGVSACAQPLAIEVVCGRDRLITNSGWSPDAAAPQALRLTDAASTASLADQSAGSTLGGFLGSALGPRLVDGAQEVEVRRHDADGGTWLEMTHDGWLSRFGLIHERRLFLDAAGTELRGEDRFLPPHMGVDDNKRRFTPFTVRFHLHPDTRASVARDNKSVLLQGPSNIGWWLRNDAVDVSIAHSANVEDGRLRRTSQIVLRGQARPDKGGRLRWKLTRAEG